jgi:hypothetical protein
MVTQERAGRSNNASSSAAQQRFDTGLATKPELLQAQQQSAINFDLQATLGAESDARVAPNRKPWLHAN